MMAPTQRSAAPREKVKGPADFRLNSSNSPAHLPYWILLPESNSLLWSSERFKPRVFVFYLPPGLMERVGTKEWKSGEEEEGRNERIPLCFFCVDFLLFSFSVGALTRVISPKLISSLDSALNHAPVVACHRKERIGSNKLIAITSFRYTSCSIFLTQFPDYCFLARVARGKSLFLFVVLVWDTQSVSAKEEITARAHARTRTHTHARCQKCLPVPVPRWHFRNDKSSALPGATATLEPASVCGTLTFFLFFSHYSNYFTPV